MKGMVLKGVIVNKESKGYFVDLCLSDKAQGFVKFEHFGT